MPLSSAYWKEIGREIGCVFHDAHSNKFSPFHVSFAILFIAAFLLTTYFGSYLERTESPYASEIFVIGVLLMMIYVLLLPIYTALLFAASIREQWRKFISTAAGGLVLLAFWFGGFPLLTWLRIYFFS